MDDKPLRQEEYMAMAEENRRLIAENEKLKAQQEKKQKIKTQTTFKTFLKIFFPALAVVSIAYLIAWCCREDSLDEKEKASLTNICYSGVNAFAVKDPWNNKKPWHIWQEHRGRKNYWEEMIEPSFATWEEGDKFYNDNHLNYCGYHWFEKMPIKRLR